MIRRMSFALFLTLALILVGVPLVAQDHSGHSGHEGHEKQAPVATGQKQMPVNPAALPEKLVDVRYKVCPIMGGEPLEKSAVIYDGKVYHFCCEGCPETFRKDPKSVIAKITDAKEVPLTITNKEGKCPVTGETASGDIYLVRGNNITFYCCADCIGKDKFEADKPADRKETEEKSGK